MTLRHWNGSALLPSLMKPQIRNRPDLIATGAHKHYISYEDGSVRLCATSGLWNVPLGYGNERVAHAIYDAALQASYLGVFRTENTYSRTAADALVDLFSNHKYSRVYFSTSGASANDLAMKIIRLYHYIQGEPTKSSIISLHDSYHGLSFGAFALTGQEMGQAVYGVDRRLIRHVQINDIEQLNKLFAIDGDSIGGIILEPILGNGCRVVSNQFLSRLFSLRARHGFIIVADEVATGFWRTGVAFASDLWPEAPDILLLSKALTNGSVAASAVLMNPRVSSVLEKVVISHGETQAGTALASAAILATLEEFANINIESRIESISGQLNDALARLADSCKFISGINGRGMMWAIQCVGTDKSSELDREQVERLVATIRDEGLVVYPGRSGIQVFPAYTYKRADFDIMATKIGLGLEKSLAQESKNSASYVW